MPGLGAVSGCPRAAAVDRIFHNNFNCLHESQVQRILYSRADHFQVNGVHLCLNLPIQFLAGIMKKLFTLGLAGL
jgi:hypothetical protein